MFEAKKVISKLCPPFLADCHTFPALKLKNLHIFINVLTLSMAFL